MTRLSENWITDPDTQAVLDIFRAAGFAIYFVGGSVRNTLAGEPVDDIDLATDAHPEDMLRIAAEAGIRALPTGADHGTVTILSGDRSFEVTTFRKDVETDGRHAKVAFSNRLDEDAQRRDFTINALYADPSGQVIDPVGGQADLAVGRVRFIGDARERIQEDFLRSLRFFRFYAAYGHPAEGPDRDALAAIAANLDGLRRLSAERVGSEMRKLLSTKDPAPAVSAMAQTGVLATLLPGANPAPLAPLVAAEQGSGTAPHDLRRLAAVASDAEAGQRLRFSRKDQKTLSDIRDGAAGMQSPAVLGYRFGPDGARDILLVRAASLQVPIEPADLAAADRAAKQHFPVRADDLMPTYQGAALGKRLDQLEEQWIASGFTLSKEELLAFAAKA
ncbi:MAG: CCA tRNA nucleotidyltransferase [Pseudomonadota bacterium]